MKQVEEGTVAFVRTSKEPVFVLGIGDDTPEMEKSTVVVRRPIQTEQGVEHVKETFELRELQTFEDKIVEELEDQSYFLEQRKAFDKASNENAKKVEVLN